MAKKNDRNSCTFIYFLEIQKTPDLVKNTLETGSGQTSKSADVAKITLITRMNVRKKKKDVNIPLTPAEKQSEPGL